MEKIGMLTIKNEYKHNGRIYCDCVCDCGVSKIIRKDHIGIGKTVSCGCFGKNQRLKSITKHGKCNTRQHRIWLDMKQRCGNPKNTAYMYYGMKGVSVCEKWKNSFIVFYNWLMNNGYTDFMTVDRIDSNGSYNPENCRLVTQSENNIKAHLGKKHIRRSKTYGRRC